MALIHYLTTTYGLLVRPGKKHLCPVCRQKAFSVKRDASVAKCIRVRLSTRKAA